MIEEGFLWYLEATDRRPQMLIYMKSAILLKAFEIFCYWSNYCLLLQLLGESDLRFKSNDYNNESNNSWLFTDDELKDMLIRHIDVKID